MGARSIELPSASVVMAVEEDQRVWTHMYCTYSTDAYVHTLLLYLAWQAGWVGEILVPWGVRKARRTTGLSEHSFLCRKYIVHILSVFLGIFHSHFHFHFLFFLSQFFATAVLYKSVESSHKFEFYFIFSSLFPLPPARSCLLDAFCLSLRTCSFMYCTYIHT